MLTTEDRHLYASLPLRALKWQMGKMADRGLSRPPIPLSASFALPDLDVPES